ncbi:uncharacterized protein LOC131675487 [Phymastichus coffea]|uniref:uncharacterized protein LOC131675487 n=1 Tax=Phymastichus coffea TaxID=108790 RepID=UPI00273AAB5C|nr:uncharacterized protein LOC131675487 [Phymastichus coffea]
MGRRKLTDEEAKVASAQKRIRDAENACLRRQAERQRIIDNNRASRQNVKHYLGPMDVLCQHCKAKHFNDEKVSNKGLSFNDCCGHGTIKLDPLPNFPPELKNLFDGEHNKSSRFFDRIRHYNNSLSFASFNANLFNFRSQRSAPYCFKIQGQIYYQINTALYPSEGENPAFGQLFIIDQNEAMQYRIQQNSVLDYNLMAILDGIIRNNNIYAKSDEMMIDEIRMQQLIAETNGNTSQPELQLLFSLKPGQDHRRYNFQRVNEVAAIFSTSADGEIPESYITIRNKNTKVLQYVSSLDPNVEPWIYPLFYPYGTQGWHVNMFRTDHERKITRLDYARTRMAIINDDFNPIIRGRRLFQQWVVDSYVKIERDRIQWCNSHQKQLRADTYQGLNDYMSNRANDVDGQVGRTIILPSTFLGSPQYMQQCYQDAMAIVNETGKPDIFLTMTCNPNWLEITENLLPGQQAADRPDLVARVFDLKKDHLLHVVTKENFFGKVASYVYVIEFQKRGLPHMHLLITLEQGYKITTPDIVDKFISAEIPIEVRNPRLFEIVLRTMIHGPCGDWCMKDGKCSKNFPKEFQATTTIDENGYPSYQRTDTGEEYECSNGHKTDNRWVVPHCPELLEMFDCHINVEIVSSIKAVKYLYKYIYEGHDAATVVIGEAKNQNTIEHNECRNFIETRYVGPVEACYRIFSKPLQHKSHSVTRLPIHLPNEQAVIITENEDEIALLACLNNSSSILLDYFTLNATNDEARQYYYTDIPKYFRHIKKKVDGQMTSSWAARKKHSDCIGRMYSISSTHIELFHLRLLLLHVKGATNYNDLRTVDNILHPSFTAACLALGIIEDDEEWNKAMREAVNWMMPRRLRHLFEAFKDSMSEDFSRNNDLNTSYQEAYAEINNLLIKEGRSLVDFPTMNQNVIVDILKNNDDEENRRLEIGNQQYQK